MVTYPSPEGFTSYERDSESSNDYAMLRTSLNRLGRFSSPDPLAGSIASPQSLNRYAYTRNDPINFVDPFGLDPCENSTADWCASVSATPGGTLGTLDPLGFSNGSGGPAPLWEEQGGGGGFYDPLARFFPQTQPPPPPGYEDCIKAALREVIANAEGTAGPEGYGLLVYGTVTGVHGSFTSLQGMTFGPGNPFTVVNPEALSGHPRIFVNTGAPRPSSAFGRYQITATTAATYRFTDFSPGGQDAAANFLMQRRNMIVPALQGNLARAMINGRPEWTSLPGGSQGRISLTQASSIFGSALNTLPECQ